MCQVYEGILPVRKQGQTHIWFTPWDYLVRWWGVQEAMVDLVERPDLVHAGVERMVEAWMVELDQFDPRTCSRSTATTPAWLGRIRLYDGAARGAPDDPAWVRPRNMWGCSNAQIFSEVSPQMHEISPSTTTCSG